MFALKEHQGYPLIFISGDLDLSNIREFEATLDTAAQSASKGLIIDMREAQYFDSRTVHVLLRFNERLKISRKKVIFISPVAKSASRILDITGISRLLDSSDNLQEATKTLNNFKLDE